MIGTVEKQEYKIANKTWKEAFFYTFLGTGKHYHVNFDDQRLQTVTYAVFTN